MKLKPIKEIYVVEEKDWDKEINAEFVYNAGYVDNEKTAQKAVDQLYDYFIDLFGLKNRDELFDKYGIVFCYRLLPEFDIKNMEAGKVFN